MMDNHNLNVEISFMDLMEKAKNNLQCEDYKTCIHFLNLALFTPALDLSSKIAVLSMNSIAHYKIKNDSQLIKSVRKIFKYMNRNLKNLPSELFVMFVKILQKASLLLEEKGEFIQSCWFLFYSKNIFDENNLKDEECAELIKSGFPRLMKKITEDNEIDEPYYLISSKWIYNLVFFIKNILEHSEDVEGLFNLNNVCLLFFEPTDEEDEDVRRDILGSYPGPINNFLLTSSSDCWIDPEETFTNSYLNKEVRENSQFIIIPKHIYSEIKENFGVLNEIERRSNLIEDNLQVEINLKKIKVLFINESLRDINKELIKPKNIQISRNATYPQLENKLKRVFKNLINSENVEYDYKFYNYDRSSREIFELIVAYCNRSKSYKIIVKELKKSENNEKLVKDLIGNKNYLIVEAIPKNMIIKPFIRILSETLNCSLCNHKIETKEIIRCENCTQNQYCSIKCKTNDLVHQEYHKKISGLFRKKLTLEEISNVKITNFLDVNSKGGLVGLKNLGNSSFINAIVQCLSHCEDFTKYFLTKSFLDDINIKQMSEAKMAKAYYDLINELWTGSNPTHSPWEFRNILFTFVKQLQNGDAQEILLLILSRLHEDLNRVKDSKMKQISKVESEEELSKVWWEMYKSKADSVIVDLFNGQMKTKIRCQSCKQVNVSYDPFMFLPLSIPDKSNQSKVRFKVFLNNFDYKFFNIEVFDVTATTNVKDIKNKIKESHNYRKMEFDALLLKNKQISQVLYEDDLVYDHVFTKIDFSQEEFIDFEIVFYEVENSSQLKNKGDFVTFYITPNFSKDEHYYLIMKYKTFNPLTYPKAFSISKKSRVKDLYIEVYKYYRRAMNDMVKIEDETENKIDTSYYEDFYSKIKDKDFIEKDFDRNYLNSEIINLNETDQNNLVDKLDNQKFDLFFLNNNPVSDSYFSRRPTCEYCKSRCEFCKIKLDLNIQIYELFATQKINRPFIIISDFTKFKDGFYKFYEEFVDSNDPRNYYKGELTIYDCLDQFSKEEKFEKETWQCDNCEKSEGFKKLEIYSPPKYLIIQFKRFKLKGHKSLMELVNNKKNESFVYYPIQNLDLGSFIIGSNNDANYELVGVTQHIGGLKDGTYSALVRNKENWFEINDETITDLDSQNKDLINQNAYLLFYRKVEKSKDLVLEENSINNI